jgi:excinuclease ABC subunit C
MIREELKAKIEDLPRSPGVYLFKNNKGSVIYVGKAKSLRNRVGSYFMNKLEVGSKTYALVSRVVDIEFIEALSELEALLLEAELIKKYQPKYNVLLKDDKSYIYIVIRNEKVLLDGKKMNVPRVLTARKTDLMFKDKVFGPYPDGNTAKYIVRSIRKIIPFRDCSTAKFSRYEKLGRPCLYGHMGLCTAPCTDKITVEEYRRDISRLEKFLTGDSVRIISYYEKEMQKASKNEDFEKAAEIRDILRKFEYVRQRFKTAGKYLENPYLVEDTIASSLDELVKNIPSLNRTPERIECYDISNISGKEAVGAMVVATNGRIDKSEYRKFKIKLKDRPDDFRMIKEVLLRRLNNDWKKPDIILVDGGKPQVTAGLEALSESGADIPLIGLAKRFETIVYFSEGHFEEVVLGKDNEGLKLLQRLRNEAHRFAQRYHHQLRLRKVSS